MVTRGLEEKRLGSYYLIDMELQFGKIKVLQMDVVMVAR